MLLFTRFYRLIASALTLCACLLACFSTQAQVQPPWLSVRSIGGSPSSVPPPYQVTDQAGNTYRASSFDSPVTIAGTQYTAQGSSDAYLAKFDATGNLVWIRVFTTTGHETIGNLVLDAANNLYLQLSSSRSLSLSSSLTIGSGYHIVRYSSQGEPTWARSISQYSYIGVDGQNHVYAVGNFETTMTLGTTTISKPPATGPYAIYLARLSAATGAVEALHLLGYYPPTGGAVFNYYAPEVVVALSGEVYLVNTFAQRLIVGIDTITSRGSYNVLVAQINTQGTPNWVQQYGGPESDFVNDFVCDASGNLYLCGSFDQTATFGSVTVTSAGNLDGYLVKYTPQGVMQWVQTGGGADDDYWSGLNVDAQGNLNLAGSFFRSAQYGTIAFIGAGGNDAVVASYTSAGQLRWAQQAGGLADDDAHSVGSDAAGNTYVYGTTRGASTFGSYTLSNTFPYEHFMARLGATTLSARSAVPLHLSLYPNPVHDQFHLPALLIGSRVQLLDALGRVVGENPVIGATLSVNGLVPGLYTLRATDAKGLQYIGRVVVE